MGMLDNAYYTSVSFLLKESPSPSFKSLSHLCFYHCFPKINLLWVALQSVAKVFNWPFTHSTSNQRCCNFLEVSPLILKMIRTFNFINFSWIFYWKISTTLNKSCFIDFYSTNWKRRFTGHKSMLIFSLTVILFRNISKMGLTGQKLSLKTTKTVSHFLKRYGNWRSLMSSLS